MNYGRNFFINSPLGKGDKGGCKSEMLEIDALSRRRTKKQPPPPPLLRGNFAANFDSFLCPEGLMDKDQYMMGK